MMYYCFPVSLALSIVTLGLIVTDGLTIESQSKYLNSAQNIILSQTETNTGFKQVPGNYESYVQAGNEAQANGNYQQAIEYYQQALKLRPQNPQLKTSLQNVIGYAFDSYMQAGYAADRYRNYSEALNNFRKALKLKPDSFHAQQAVRNVTTYLAFNQEKLTPSETNSDLSSLEEDLQSNKWIESNKIWFLWGIGAASLLAIFLLINLFRPKKSVKKVSKIMHRGMTEKNSPGLEKTSHNESSPNSNGSQLSSSEISNSQLTPTHHQSAVAPPPINSQSTTPTAPITPEIISNSLDSEITQSAEPLATGDVSTAVASDNNHQILKTNNNSNQSEPVNQVTIVTSKTTKIDLVFELIKDLQEGERSVRRKAIWELAQKSDSRGIPALIELMPKVDSLERNLILEAITQITSRTLQPMNRVLLESLEDENPQVRKNAIRDLTRLCQLMSNVTKRLSQMTEDADLEVQQTARWALQELDRVPTVQQTIKQEQKYNQDRLST